ncbi:MAG: CHAT domain-containing protein, partial [Phycisphaerae bacterium]|nr:CHAT domain-containing protein [Saprospiraceae bacterium]
LQKGGQESNYLASLYINMGGCKDDLGQPREAIRLYVLTEANLLTQDTAHPFLVNLFNNIGTSSRELGEFTAAIRYLEKATAIVPEDGRYWNNLGEAYRSNNQTQKAKNCFMESIRLLTQAKKPQPFQLARPYHNLAILYRQRGQLDSALTYELRSLPLRKTNPNAFLDIARTYHGVGECYLAQGFFEKALLYLDSALLLQRRIIPTGLNAEIAASYLSKARCMAGLERFVLSMSLTDSALYACGYSSEAKFNEVIAPIELLTALEQKGNLFYQQYKHSKDENMLSASEMTFDTAAQAVRYFRNTLLESESRATLAGQFRDILSGGVEAALAMHRLHPETPIHLARAFAFSEQSKALVLLEGVRSAGTLKFEGISDSLLDRERSLRQAVTDAEVGLRKMLGRGNAASDSLVTRARNELFGHQRAFEAFQRNLASGDFAQYYNFRYGLSLATPEEIQAQLLSPNRSLISYFVGKNQKITAFVLQKNGFQVIECAGGESLEKQVRALRQGLFGYYTLAPRKRTEALYAKSLEQYTTAAQALYSILLAPLEHLLSEQVVIVPDGDLSYVPFELLLTDAPAQITNFSEYSYWFKAKNRSVSYTYSATLLREMTQKQHRKKPSKMLLAMAPFFPGTRADLAIAPPAAAQDENRKNLNPLVYSGQEVRDIGQICKSPDWWVGKEANKQVFLRYAPECQMLHLSTHGVLDSTADFSYLAFAAPAGDENPEPLFVRELYSLQLNADLVTLSACETGVGEFQRGEGV